MVIIYNTVWFKHLKIEFITHGRAGKSFHSDIQALILKKTVIKGFFCKWMPTSKFSRNESIVYVDKNVLNWTFCFVQAFLDLRY